MQGQLEHPAIVPVYDLGVDADGTPYFTMKRVRGVTLDEILDAPRARRRERRAREYTRRKLLAAFAQRLPRDRLRARARRAAPRPQAGEHHARRLRRGLRARLGPREGRGAASATLGRVDAAASRRSVEQPDDRSRHRRPAPSPGRRAARHAGLHGARAAARRDDRSTRAPTSTRSARSSSRCSRSSRSTARRRSSAMIEPRARAASTRARRCARPSATCRPSSRPSACARARARQNEPLRLGPRARRLHRGLSQRRSRPRDARRARAVHLDHARDAAARMMVPGASHDERMTALREVGRAIALAPDNTDALALLVRILTARRRSRRSRSLEAINRSARDSQRKMLPRMALAYSASWIRSSFRSNRDGHPELGARAHPAVALDARVAARVGRLQARSHRAEDVPLRDVISRRRARRDHAPHGPFLVVPAIAGVLAMGLALVKYKHQRIFSTVVNVLAVVVPSLLAGRRHPVVHRFVDGALVIMPGRGGASARRHVRVPHHGERVDRRPRLGFCGRISRSARAARAREPPPGLAASAARSGRGSARVDPGLPAGK